MKKEQRLLRAMGQANEQYIQDAAPGRGRTVVPLWRKVTAVAAALALVVAAGWVGFRLGTQGQPGTLTDAAMAAITFDVNPSVELVVDNDETVLEANALNDDGAVVLGGMELVDTNLETATNALIGAFLTNGYLDELQNAILVSVEDRNGDSTALKEKLSANISALLKSDGVEGAVLSQMVTSDEELTALAKQYGLSLGKTALIQTIIAQDNTLTFDAMAQLTITELVLVAENRGLDISSLSQVGEVSDTGYLGMTSALEIACEAAGITMEEALSPEVEMDGKNGSIIYEVEFCCNGIEYEYELDAVTGEILKQDQDTCNHPEHNGNAVDTSGYIGVEAAKQAALKDAGVTAAQTTYLNGWLEYHDGKPECYQVEFAVYDSTSKVKTVYEYEIDLTTGKVLDKESERYQDQTSTGNSGNSGNSGSSGSSGTSGSSGSTGNSSSSGSSGSSGSTGNSGSTGTSGSSSSYIGTEAAKKAALADAGVSASQTKYINCWTEYSNGTPKYYQVEFAVYNSSTKVETVYSYQIGLTTGNVLSKSSKTEHEDGDKSESHSEEHSSSSETSSASYIGESAALKIAYDHAGVSASDAKEVQCKLDSEDHRMIYDIEFNAGGTDYEYSIDATTGAVISCEKNH